MVCICRTSGPKFPLHINFLVFVLAIWRLLWNFFAKNTHICLCHVICDEVIHIESSICGWLFSHILNHPFLDNYCISLSISVADVIYNYPIFWWFWISKNGCIHNYAILVDFFIIFWMAFVHLEYNAILDDFEHSRMDSSLIIQYWMILVITFWIVFVCLKYYPILDDSHHHFYNIFVCIKYHPVLDDFEHPRIDASLIIQYWMFLVINFWIVFVCLHMTILFTQFQKVLYKLQILLYLI